MTENPKWLEQAYEVYRDNQNPDWLNEALEQYRALRKEDTDFNEYHKTKAEGDFTSDLMASIRLHEGGRHGYDAWYNRDTPSGPVAPPKPPTQMTVNEVLEWQNTHNPEGPETTAIGAYQIVDQPNARTLSGLKRSMGLTGEEIFTPELQDHWQQEV